MTRIATDKYENVLYIEHRGGTTRIDVNGAARNMPFANVDDALLNGFHLIFDNTKPEPLPMPEVGEHVWIQRGEEGGTPPTYGPTFLVGTVTEYDRVEGNDFLCTDDPKDAGTYIPTDVLPAGHTRVVAWGLVEKEYQIGDIVPAHTKLPYVWTGVAEGLRPGSLNHAVTLLPTDTSSHDRRMVWKSEETA